MQKKLLTMAVAGALAAPCIALAQGSAAPGAAVEVYGTINMAAGQFKYSDTKTAGNVAIPSISKWDVAQGASNYGLRGRESLGGGLTAWFQIEQNAPMERSDNIAITPASRNSAVGLQGGFGNIFLGQWTTPWADLDALWSVGTVGFWGPVTSIIGRRETTGTTPNPNCVNGHLSGAPGAAGVICDAIEAGGGVGHPFWRRASQAIVYQSPVFSGFQFKFLWQTNERGTSSSRTQEDGMAVRKKKTSKASVAAAKEAAPMKKARKKRRKKKAAKKAAPAAAPAAAKPAKKARKKRRKKKA
jgi:predicted porin